MKEILVTLTGISHYYDDLDLEPYQEVLLIKEPMNKNDKEAIAVYINHNTKVGYVANSTYTVAKGCYSAGRLYDKIGNEKNASLLVVYKGGAIISVKIEE